MEKHIERGDFQTPMSFADKLLRFLKEELPTPSTIIEPTCGVGSLVLHAHTHFPHAHVYGFDINSLYIDTIQNRIPSPRIHVHVQDFFTYDWKKCLVSVQKPILILGNPPWVTISKLSKIHGNNSPSKSNIHAYKGIDAITGRGNFDISEYIIEHLSTLLSHTFGTMVMICKVSVARKVIHYYHKNHITNVHIHMHIINAKEIFNVSTESCVFIVRFTKKKCKTLQCHVYNGLTKDILYTLQCTDSYLFKHTSNHDRLLSLIDESRYEWRSGVKHDIKDVMECTTKDGIYINGRGNEVHIEDEYIYPCFNATDLFHGNTSQSIKHMIIPQKSLNEKIDPSTMLYNYLKHYKNDFKKRKSRIYHNKPWYSVFGIGEYTFKPYKIAISGFHSDVTFRFVSPIDNTPCVLDDTCYFIGVDSKIEGLILYHALNHPISKKFFTMFIFPNDKRPITKTTLELLSVEKLLKKIRPSYFISRMKKETIPQEDIKKCLETLKNFKFTSTLTRYIA